MLAITVARKPLDAPTVAMNLLKWGTGGINLDASRVGTEPRIKQESDGTPFRGNGGSLVGGTGRRPSGWVLGRHPANLLLCPLVAEAIDAQSGITKSPPVGTVSKRKPYRGLDGKAFKTPDRIVVTGHGDRGGASRYFKIIKEDTHGR